MDFAFVGLEGRRAPEPHVGGPVGLKHVKHRVPHRVHPRLLGRHLDQVVHLVGVGLQVVQLVFVPDPVVVDVLVAVPPDGVGGRGLREGVLPEVLVDKARTPVGGLAAAQQRQKRVPVRHGPAGQLQDGRGDIDVQHVLLDGAARGDIARGPRQHRHPHRLLVGLPLVNKPVLAQHKAVVAHVDDQGVLGQPLLLQEVQHPGNALVDPHQGLAVLGDDLLQVLRVVIAVVVHMLDPVPAVALLAHPIGLAFVVGLDVLHRLGSRDVGPGVLPLVALGRGELGVHGLVGQVGEERLVLLAPFDPVEGVVGQQVGDVAVHLPALPVDVQGGVLVDALAPEAHPAVKAGFGVVAGPADMPLAEKGGLVAGLLQLGGEKGRALPDWVGIVDGPVAERVLPGQDRGPGGGAQGGGHKGVGQVRPLAGHPVHARGLQERRGLRVEAHVVVAVVIAQNENHVLWLGLNRRNCE